MQRQYLQGSNMRWCWNRQTGTFEGRVSLTYGFKSHSPHQIMRDYSEMSSLFIFIFFVSILISNEIHGQNIFQATYRGVAEPSERQ